MLDLPSSETGFQMNGNADPKQLMQDYQHCCLLLIKLASLHHILTGQKTRKQFHERV